MFRPIALLLAAYFAFVSSGTVVGQIFTDDLSSDANWTVRQSSDASAVFGFDYSTKGVPAAPNGNDTIGLKFEVNNAEPASVDEIAAFNTNAAYTGQFTFRVDVWANWAPDGGTVGTGTTEFIGVNVGSDAVIPSPIGGTFIYTGDGDAAATDYRLYKDDIQLQSESGQYASGTEAGARDHTNPYFMDAFPEIDIATAVPTQGTTGTVRAGAAGYQWMTLNVEVDTDAIGPSGNISDPGFARISMRSDSSGNTIEVGTIDNSNGDAFPANLGGSVGLMMADLFSSVTVDPNFSFGLFDNVQVLEGLVPLSEEGPAGDFNNSNFVEGQDFLEWQRNPGVGSLSDWEQNYGTGNLLTAVAAVPEPTTAGLLLALALIALPARGR